MPCLWTLRLRFAGCLGGVNPIIRIRRDFDGSPTGVELASETRLRKTLAAVSPDTYGGGSSFDADGCGSGNVVLLLAVGCISGVLVVGVGETCAGCCVRVWLGGVRIAPAPGVGGYVVRWVLDFGFWVLNFGFLGFCVLGFGFLFFGVCSGSWTLVRASAEWYR